MRIPTCGRRAHHSVSIFACGLIYHCHGMVNDVVGQAVQAPDLTDGLPVRFSFVLDGVVKQQVNLLLRGDCLGLNGSQS
jgi:hypothetical protein